MSETKKIGLPSILAFERKLEISDGLMYAGKWSNKDIKEKTIDKDIIWQDIKITPRYNRSTQSSYVPEKDRGKKDINKTQANPVASGDDMAVIPTNCDTLKVSWTMRVIGNVGKPFACNQNDFEQKITEKIEDFDFTELAKRYAYNIANGRFLWRNRVCAEEVEIQVYIKGSEKNPLIFNAYDFSLLNFKKKNDDKNLKILANHIKEGLADTTGEKFIAIKVEAFVKLDESQQVFPSEEMNTKEKGKTLFKLNDCAAMHNVKIGNAIRTIDDWYDDQNCISRLNDKKVSEVKIDTKPIIAIEPYGSVTQRGMAYRASKYDLYTLLQNLVNDKELSKNDKNYVVACFIRGGLFQGESSK
jgi:CRISPR-associated protein Csy3